MLSDIVELVNSKIFKLPCHPKPERSETKMPSLEKLLAKLRGSKMSWSYDGHEYIVEHGYVKLSSVQP